MTYLDTTASFYDGLARAPGRGACCAQRNDVRLPGLVVPERMAAMTYSCGTTVHPEELRDGPSVLYVGVGGGLEALQFAYFARRPGAVIAVDPVATMRDAAIANLREAARVNEWFDIGFVLVLPGDAFALPVPSASIDLVAQNCLFNIFEPADLRRALTEAYRVLKPGGRLMMSDPIATRPIPTHLRRDERLRAMCLSGALTYDEYVGELAQAGFRHIEIRARKHYRTLDPVSYALDTPLVLESLDTVSRRRAAFDEPLHTYTGRRAIYIGALPEISHGGIRLRRHEPRLVSDQTAAALSARWPREILLTPSTWRYAPSSS